MIPFFVADRPMSLRIIKGLPLQEYPQAKIGIMAHANTSANFQKALSEYPCENLAYCDAIGGPCKYKDAPEKIEGGAERQYSLAHTVKMCDSGMFTKEGVMLTYEAMFDTYVRMGVEYGIMIDVFRDCQATLESAKQAMEAYKPYKNKFKLVTVAQGKTVEEYFECYQGLKALECEHIAVGGLLQRVEETVRYAQVRDEDFMYDVLDTIREAYPDDWLFALGSFHPNRLAEFKERDVWGDYKGWIFQYEKIDRTLDRFVDKLQNNHLAHLSVSDHRNYEKILAQLTRAFTLRQRLMHKRDRVHKKLLAGRRQMRADMSWLYGQIKKNHAAVAARLDPILTHTLLDKAEEQRVINAVQLLIEKHKERGQQLVTQVTDNRAYKERLNTLDQRISGVNQILSQIAETVVQKTKTVIPDLAEICQNIVQLLETSEREHRFAQVHEKIAHGILAHIPNVATGYQENNATAVEA